jgi:hypothetical protein
MCLYIKSGKLRGGKIISKFEWYRLTRLKTVFCRFEALNGSLISNVVWRGPGSLASISFGISLICHRSQYLNIDIPDNEIKLTALANTISSFAAHEYISPILVGSLINNVPR